MSHAASDSHSVDREENTPSSDTETVGGVSNVSIDASSSAVALEPEVMVDDIVVGRAVREAIRGLDALDISAIFSRRASVMRSPPKFLSGAFRSAMRVALHEIVTGAERHDESVQCRGSGTVQRFLPQKVGPVVDAIRRLQRSSIQRIPPTTSYAR